jgi:hypothetical protein
MKELTNFFKASLPIIVGVAVGMMVYDQAQKLINK